MDMIFSATIKNKGIFFDNPKDYNDFLAALKDGQKLIVDIRKAESQRTEQQNRALHLYFELLAEELNNAGLELRKVLKPEVDVPWTRELVKELIWRPVQKIYLKKTSTTRLNKQEDIDQVWEIINRHLGEKFGIYVQFPSLESLMLIMENNARFEKNEQRSGNQ